MLKHEWNYDTVLEIFCFGSSNDGAGVFKTEDENGWTGNVVVCSNIYGLDISASKEEAQIEAENLYEELKSIYQ